MRGGGEIVGLQRSDLGRGQQQQVKVQLGQVGALGWIRRQPQAGRRVDAIGEPEPDVATGDSVAHRQAGLRLPEGAQRFHPSRRGQTQMHGMPGGEQGRARLQRRCQRLGANDDGDTGQGTLQAKT